MSKTKPKVAVIRQELLELTGDYRQALVLSQLLHWTSRVRDFDKFIEEEQQRIQTNLGEIGYPNIEKQNGWIYKTAEEMAKETMLGLAPKNMRKHIKELVNKGIIEERRNPKYNWDKTLQYRVDTIKLQIELYKLGYNVSISGGYVATIIDKSIQELADPSDETSIPRDETSLGDNETYNGELQNDKAIPKITTEITSKITTESFYNGGNLYDYPRVSTYFSLYDMRFKKPHPNLKIEQVERAEGIIRDFMSDNDLVMPDLNAMIRKHFTTNYSQNIDYNINHFASYDLLQNRWYEVESDYNG